MTEEDAKKAVDEYFKDRMKDVDYLNKRGPDVKDLDEATKRLNRLAGWSIIDHIEPVGEKGRILIDNRKKGPSDAH